MWLHLIQRDDWRGIWCWKQCHIHRSTSLSYVIAGSLALLCKCQNTNSLLLVHIQYLRMMRDIIDVPFLCNDMSIQVTLISITITTTLPPSSFKTFDETLELPDFNILFSQCRWILGHGESMGCSFTTRGKQTFFVLFCCYKGWRCLDYGTGMDSWLVISAWLTLHMV